jgi:hypothetical protein
MNHEIQRLIPLAAVGVCLSIGLATGSAGEIPETEATPLRPGIDAERMLRLETAQKNFEQIKTSSTGFGNRGHEIGVLLAPVLVDDPHFVAEVLDAWLPAAEADKSGKQMAALANGLVSHGTARDIEATMATLILLDSLWEGSTPPATPDTGDPIGQLWRVMDPENLENPELWRRSATLSPKLQARFWLKSEIRSGPNFAKDPALAATLRDASNGSEIIRTAFEWHMWNALMSRDYAKADVNTLLAFPRALKDAGLPPDEFAKLVCGPYSYNQMDRLENPRVLMAETPVLLDGLQTLPGDLADDIIMVLSYSRYLWFKDGDSGDVDTSGAAGFGDARPLLEWVLTRVPESSLSPMTDNGMTSAILASGDGELFGLWAKAKGKSAAGNVPLIVALLEKGRVAEAVALDPPPGTGLYSPGKFTAHMEQLVARLRSDPSLLAFHLAVLLSMMDDARPPEAPVEKKAERQKRLAAEFERVREDMPVEDRAGFLLSLGIFRSAQGHHPALDEFTGEAAAREFRTMLSSGRMSATAMLFVNYACSRAIAGDLSGIREITTAIDSAPIGVLCDNAVENMVLGPVHGCFTTIANNTDARLPKAAVEAVLGFAKALAGRQTPALGGPAARLVHLASKDAASLASALKHCGLERETPAMPGTLFACREMSAESLSMEIRVGLLHPSSSKTLLASLDKVMVSDDESPLVPLLGDPKLRALIPPEGFVKWNRGVRHVAPEGFASMNLYIKERHGEFDRQQLIETENLMYHLEYPNPDDRNIRHYYDWRLNGPWKWWNR